MEAKTKAETEEMRVVNGVKGSRKVKKNDRVEALGFGQEEIIRKLGKCFFSRVFGTEPGLKQVK